MSRLSLVITMLLALVTSASAEKVDWSNYIDKNPSAPPPASKTPVVASADDPPPPAKTSKTKKKKAAPKHKAKAKPKHH